MNADRSARMALMVGTCALLVLALGIAGYALGRSLRTSKAQAREAGRVSMARAYDATYRDAYRAAIASGLSHGRPEGEAIGRQRGAASGRRHGELLKARRLARQAGRGQAHGTLRIAHRPQVGARTVHRAAQRRRPHRVQPHRARHKRREPRVLERESLGGEGREGEEGVPEGRERAREREAGA